MPRTSVSLVTLLLLHLAALAPARAHVVQHCPEADHCGREAACDDGDPCTRDICEVADDGEGCCEHEPIQPCLDAFLCYDLAAAEKTSEPSPPAAQVQLLDRFGDRRYRLGQARALCNPADRGSGTHDAKTRLQRHPIAPTTGGPAGAVAKGVKVKTEIGSLRVDLMRSDALLLQAAVDVLGPPPRLPAGRLDRFACHDVRPTKEPTRTRRGVRVKLQEHFAGAPKLFEVMDAERLCTAVAMNGAGLVDACAAFLCYGVEPARDEPAFAPLREIWVRDEFALRQVDALAPTEVCLPALVDGRTCLPRSYACESDVECTTNHCVDGVCCDTACDAPCHACLGSLTGRPHGTCAPATGDAQCPSRADN
jgi:hypothetical protein